MSRPIHIHCDTSDVFDLPLVIFIYMRDLTRGSPWQPAMSGNWLRHSHMNTARFEAFSPKFTCNPQQGSLGGEMVEGMRPRRVTMREREGLVEWQGNQFHRSFHLLNSFIHPFFLGSSLGSIHLLSFGRKRRHFARGNQSIIVYHTIPFSGKLLSKPDRWKELRLIVNLYPSWWCNALATF